VIGACRLPSPCGVEQARARPIGAADDPLELVDRGGHDLRRIGNRRRVKARVDRRHAVAQAVGRGPSGAQRGGEITRGGGDAIVVGDGARIGEQREPRGAALRARFIGGARERVREREAERLAEIVAPGDDVVAQQERRGLGRGSAFADDAVDDASRDGVEVRGGGILQGANYNEGMFVVRFATLAALVVWLAAMTASRFGGLMERIDLVAYVCGAITLVGLFVMKFVGPPPAGFVPRAAIAVAMLAVAAAAAFARSVETAAMLVTLNIALGFVLLMWYVRE
jgi:hypothetical protein